MKILVYSSYHFNSSAFGPILETLQHHLNNGDEVLFLSCGGELTSCQINPFHNKLVCKTCVNFRDNALSCLNGKFKKIQLKDIVDSQHLDFQYSKINLSSIDDFKTINYKSFDIGMAIFSSIVSIYRNPLPNLPDYEHLIKSQWESSVTVFEAINKLINEEKLDRVYVFNGRFAVLRACLRACEANQTDCFVLEESNDRSKYAIYPNSTPHSIKDIEQLIRDYWENGSENKRETAMAYYQNRSQGKDTRFGHFVSDQINGALPVSWDINKKNIAIFVSSEDEYVSIGKEWENTLYASQADGIKQISTAMLPHEDYVFYVRIHPNLKGLKNESIEELYAIKNKNIVIIPADSPVSTYALMLSAQKVISFGSSVGIEAAAFGKISILSGKSFYMNLGSTYNPNDHNELIQLLLENNLDKKPVEGALMYANFLIHFGESYTHFKQIDNFSGYLNNKKFRLSLVFLGIRQIGRTLRIWKETKKKKQNIKYVSKL